MAEINLARVDDRLVHGQVMQVWTKGHGTNAAYVIDDATAADEFMKEIYESTQSTGGLAIKVFSSDSIVDEWNKNQFGNDNVALIFKSIAYAKKAVDGGVPIKELNVGGIAIKPGTTKVIESVGLSKDDAELCKALDAAGVKVYFQKIPSSENVSLSAALAKMG
ncbi:PTS system mannose/fructose/N-acetylgalactosamine-transporter subunit IIB [Collinsella bouchesdurhonensis]|uniref:PTS system mannose/fructose/N-acetylgalactosamine-transporter subunit IIB n=1 Tax=Collinsella bouchesdurhonensis TaxID=1907654 RepID=UPI00058B6AED|nr:PTS sugar transporter subunit IIB [Collinsella bouchesdurhonensis]